MKLKQTLEFTWNLEILALALAGLSYSPSAMANVYATNIKLNGGITNIVSPAGQGATISYILNEAASLAVEIDIYSGANVVRRLTLSAGNPGTDRGPNTVTWDGLDNGSNTVPAGTYQVSVSPSSAGYTNWTQITLEDDPGADVNSGRGIAVDRNVNSPYYGRIYVANALEGLSPDSKPGDVVGILKLNPDGTFAEEVPNSSGYDGHNWSGNDVSPWKIRVSNDEWVYVGDLGLSGEVFRWDALLSSNSLVNVLSSNNIPSGAQLSGPEIVGTGTNTQVWMADTNGSNGVLKWVVTANGVCAPNDLGKTVVGIGTDPTTNLTMAPYSVAVDKSGNIYACQFITGSGDPTSRVLRFPAYDPSTNGGAAEVNADWAVGTNDDTYTGASGLAVDPTGTYLAVAFQGLQIGGLFQDGNTKILYATNGALVANLDLGLAIGGDANHQDTDCAWDAVGNVYCVDNWFGKWRAFSPPGTNHSTTVALASIQVTGSTGGSGPPPTITQLSVSNGIVTIHFTGTASDVPANFGVVGAAAVTGPYNTINNATITQVSSGAFRATFPSSGNMSYYRIQRLGGSVQPGGQAPKINSLTLTNGTVTLTFTGATTDTQSQFTLLSSSAAGGPYNVTPGQTINLVSPGSFRATAPASGPIQFYRLKR
jgi:hypothetical protein